MDNSSENISKTILQSNEMAMPSINIDNSNDYLGSLSSNDSGTFLDSIKNISLTTWLIIIFILALLGINIFIYLAKGTQDISNFFTPLFKKLFGGLVITGSQIVDVTATGTKAVVNTTADTINTGLTDIQNVLPQGVQAQTTVKNTPVQNTIPQADVLQNNTLNRALNTSNAQQSNKQDYQEDESTSNIQMGGTKTGYCYIGEDRGYRSCAYIGVNDTCLSGEIFPTNEICVNPNLRT
jgi:hypothetical protein